MSLKRSNQLFFDSLMAAPAKQGEQTPRSSFSHMKFPSKKIGFKESDPLGSQFERSKGLHDLESFLSLSEVNLSLISKLIRAQNEIGDHPMKREDKIKALKFLRKHFIKVITKQTLSVAPDTKIGCHWLRQDSNLSLIHLATIERSCDKDSMAIAVLSILGKSRDLNLEPSGDTSPITKSLSVPEDNIKQLCLETKQNGSSLGIGRNELLYGDISVNLFGSGKSGPLGPAMLSSIREFHSYSEEQIKVIDNFIRHYAPFFGKVKSGNSIQELITPITYKSTGKYVRRLSAIADYEGKTRIIAIGDYGSNVILKPIHVLLMKALKSIKADMTYGHHLISDNVKSYYKTNRKGFSIDLTAATDRLPVDLTVQVIKEYFDDELIGTYGKDLMVSFPFRIKSTCNLDVNYQVGQPMGLYSSGPAMALTNHVIVRLAAKRLGFDKFTDYMIIGDDIVIYNENIANEYIRIIEYLGVQGKPEDSIYPRTSHPCEIAKRVFRNGIEVSPIPLNLSKTNQGLFFFYLLNRDVLIDLPKFRILAGGLRPLVAAHMSLYYSKCDDGIIDSDTFTYDNITTFVSPSGVSLDVSNALTFKVDTTEDVKGFLLITYIGQSVHVDSKIGNRINLTGKPISLRQFRKLTKAEMSGGRNPTSKARAEILSQQPFLCEALKQSEKYTDDIHSLAGSRSHIGLCDFIYTYRNLSEHYQRQREQVLITKDDILTNPVHQIENAGILKGESSLSLLNENELALIYNGFNPKNQM